MSGILPFLFTTGVLVRWLSLSAGYVFTAYALAVALATFTGGELMTMAAMYFWAAGSLVGVLCTAVLAGCLKAVVTESSYGSDVIENWNTHYLLDWFPDLFFLLISAFAASLPGALFAVLAPDILAVRIALVGGCFLLAFPIVYLSQLHCDSIFGFVSRQLLATFPRFPGTWLLFYMQAVTLAAACIAVAYITPANVVVLVTVPLLVAAFFAYARLLGRLGWRFSAATTAAD